MQSLMQPQAAFIIKTKTESRILLSTTEDSSLVTDFLTMLENLASRYCRISEHYNPATYVTSALKRALDRCTWPGSATTGTPGIQRAPSFFPMMAASTPPRQIFTPLQLARPHKPGNDDTLLPGRRENREVR